MVISVVDRNEHAPQFTSSSFTAQLFLDLGDPTIGVDETTERVVLRVRATDQDTGENARIFYSILSGTSFVLFKKRKQVSHRELFVQVRASKLS